MINKERIEAPSNVLKVSDLMALTGWSKGHIYRLTSKGLIPYSKPFGKSIFFDRKEIEKVLLSNRQETARELSDKASDYVNQKLTR